jgi:tetratricopeptide (TPR) repeat protein
MRRKINLKAVLILSLSAAALGVGVYFVHGFQVRRNAKGVLEQALQAERDGQTKEALDYYEQYLGLAPDDNDALAKYALLRSRNVKTPRERVQVYLALERASHRDGNREDVRRRAAQVALEIGRFVEAKEHLDFLLHAHPEDVELLRLRARADIGTRQYDKAQEWYAQAIQLAPKQIDLTLDYAMLLRLRRNRPDAADEAFERLVRADPQSVPARLAAARYFRYAGAVDRAEKHIQAALDELHAEEADVFLLAADLAQARAQSKKAYQYLEQGLERHPKDSRLLQGLARLEIQAGRSDKALQYLEASLREMPEQPEALWGLADMLIEVGELGKADDVIRRLGDDNTRPEGAYLQARILARKEAWGQARITLEKVRAAKLPSPELDKHVNFLLAQCYARLNNPDQQLNACQRALKSDPLWLPARRGLATALAALGRTEHAIAEYRQIVTKAPELQTELARLLLHHTLRQPAAEQNWAEVEAAVKALPEASPQSFETLALRADLLFARNRIDEALQLVEAERKRDPKQVGPWLLLAYVAEREGKPEKVLPLLEEAEEQVGKRVDWHLARARYWATSGKAEAPKHLAAIETEMERYSGSERDRLLAGLAEAYAIVGDNATADRLWRQLATRQPNALGVRVLLLEAAVGAGKEAEVDQLLGEITRIEGDGGAIATYGEAARQFQRASKGNARALEEARQLAAEAATLCPSWSRVQLLEAQIHDTAGQKEKALEKYLAALDQGESRAAVYRRVLQLLYEQRRYTEANALMRKLPEKALASPDLGRIASQLTLLSQQGVEGPESAQARKRALEIARQTVVNSKDYRDYLWLGQLAILADKPDEAEKALREARTLAEAVPDTWAALVFFLAKTDVKKAEAEMAQARAKLPKEAVPIVLATCYEALGRPEQAEEHYRAALAAKPDDPAVLRRVASFYSRIGQLAKTEAPLRKLIESRTGVAEDTVLWARRHLALALAFQGQEGRFQEALELIAANGKTKGPTAEDRQTRALVLATRPNHRQAAIKLFEELAPHSPATPPAVRFLLAQLYEAEGHWSKARGHLLALLGSDEKNPVYLAGYARSLLRHGEAEEAQVWVDKLTKLGRRDFETIELRARVLKATRKPNVAVRLVRSYAEETDVPLDRVAFLLDELGETTAAESALRKHLSSSRRPEDVLLLARFLARHERLPEALALCSQAEKTCPLESVAGTTVAALRAGRGSADDYQRVERWLAAAIQNHPESKTLPAFLAEMQDNCGRHDEAIALYRQILHGDRRNFVALNNLAYILALKEGANPESLELINAAIDIVGPFPELLDTRAVVYLRSNRADLALKDLLQATSQKQSPSLYFHLAQAHRVVKHGDAARVAFGKAKELGLKADDLHPLEHATFVQLKREMGSE